MTLNKNKSSILNLLQHASTQCDVDPLYVPTELLSTYSNLPQPSVMLIHCMCPQSYCPPTSTCLNPVWCWSRARAWSSVCGVNIVNKCRDRRSTTHTPSSSHTPSSHISSTNLTVFSCKLPRKSKVHSIPFFDAVSTKQ